MYWKQKYLDRKAINQVKKLNEEIITNYHHSLWDKAKTEYGTVYKVPSEETYRMGELVRGLHVLQLWQKSGGTGSAVRFLRRYDLPPRAIDALVVDYLEYFGVESEDEIEKAQEPVEKRSEKFNKFLKWANEHHFEQFTTEQLTEQSGFSYQTTLKYLQESPTFRKLKKGLWEIRDAKFDREAAGK